jgi:tetratricopeptide (TPR) repeat protein
MRFTNFLPLVFALSCFWTGAADASQAQAKASFQVGVEAFQKGDTKLARTSFQEALKQDPNQVVVLYNLGLAEQRAGKNGLAMGIWRKALALSPGFYPAEQAITWTRGKLERADIPHDVESWETLRNSVLASISMEKFEALTAILFFVFAWLALGYIGKRRRALLDEKPLPAPPFAPVIAGVLFAIVGLLAIAKAVDIQDLRATVVVKKVEARALPEDSATVLFDLYEGLEVIVRGSRQGWIQVTYPGGATGWVSRSSVFTTSDRVTP